MKKIIFTITLASIIAFHITGCSTENGVTSEQYNINKENETTLTVEEKNTTDEMANEITKEICEESKDAANIESDKNFSNIEVTLPDTIDESTDEELEALKSEDGYISITRNEDNSITYVMTKDKQKELLNKLEERFKNFSETTPGSEDYPNVTKLEVNKDFSVFTITTTATTKDEISFSESILASVFYSFGGAYRGYACEKDTSVTVNYICDSTGELIASGNSSNVE